MKKYLLIATVFISASINAQQIKTYYHTLNPNGTIDSGYVKIFTDSLFAYSDNSFVAFTVERYARVFGAPFPNNFGNYRMSADGIYRNFSQITQGVRWDDVNNKPSTFTPSTHSHIISDVTNLQTTLDGKLATDGNGSSLTGLTKSQVGLANVDNTSDANKPVSTATQTALNNKSTIHFGLDAGANDSYTITASPAPAAYTQGMVVMFRANTQNTTGCSINVNGLGVKTIVKRVSTTPATGDILAQMFCWLIYDGTNFVILNPVVN